MSRRIMVVDDSRLVRVQLRTFRKGGYDEDKDNAFI